MLGVLVRAAWTGSTLELPRHETPPEPTLFDVRCQGDAPEILLRCYPRYKNNLALVRSHAGFLGPWLLAGHEQQDCYVFRGTNGNIPA